MGLGDFSKEPNDENGGTAREYTVIKQEDFEKVLNDISEEFHIIGTEEDSNLKFTRELVYATDEIEHDDLQLRVYSTIDESTSRCRKKGSDAIRTVIWSKKNSMPIAGRTKTLRIQTWAKNLREKIKDLLNNWEDKIVNCDECGGYLKKKEPGEDDDWDPFYGCIKYPVCQNTKPVWKVEDIEDWDV